MANTEAAPLLLTPPPSPLQRHQALQNNKVQASCALDRHHICHKLQKFPQYGQPFVANETCNIDKSLITELGALASALVGFT